MKITFNHSFITRQLLLSVVLLGSTTSGIADDSQNGMSRSQALTIEQMEGLKIDASNYRDYITTGNPGSLSDLESLKKIFFFYNVGTKKFLSSGGYWGSHAALSDTPHPFWLQLQTENIADQYAIYPFTPGTTDSYSAIMTFWNLPKVWVGSQEGNIRSNAIYKSITHTYTSGSTTKSDNLLTSLGVDANYEANEKKFTTDAVSNPFEDDGTITIVMDLKNCKNHGTAKDSKGENILSVGNNISAWGQTEGIYNLHIYYFNDQPRLSSTTSEVKGNLEIEYVDKSWGDSRRKYMTISGDDLTFVLNKQGIKIIYQDASGNTANAYYYTSANVPYQEGKEGQVAYFPMNSDGTYKTESDGSIIADPTLTAETGKPYAYEGEIKADRNGNVQKLFISSKIEKQGETYANEGKFLAYAFNKGNDNASDVGIYMDRSVANNPDLGIAGAANILQAKKMAQWTFDYSPSQNGQNLCWLQLNIPCTAEGKLDLANPDVPFKLQPSPYYVQGNEYENGWIRNRYYNFDLYDDENSEGNPTKTPKGEYEDTADGDQADVFYAMDGDAKLAQWKIVSVYDYFQMATALRSNLQEAADMSFTIQDNGFLRDNATLANWKIDETLKSTSEEIAAGKAKLHIGVDEYYKTTPTDTYYYNQAGKQLSKTDSKEYNAELRNHSRYSGVCITNGGYGKFYQDVKVYSPGWYIVGCKGTSNVGAQLYAEVEGKKSAKALCAITDKVMHYMMSEDAKELYWPFDIKHPLYNTVAMMTDNFVKSYHKDDNHNCRLWIYVENASEEQPATLRLGVEVAQGDGTSALSDDDTEDVKDWTVFDDFKLFYGGKMDDQSYLILDETKTNLDYIDEAKITYDNRTMCLNRTFKLNQWNSIILPVGLTKAQFANTFGSDSKLAKLSELTETQIRFQTITEETQDEYGNSYWLQPNVPYIIKPTQAGDEPEYTITLPTWNNTTLSVTAEAGHYKIPQVTLDARHNPNFEESDGSTHWNFGGKKVNIEGKDYKYLVEGNKVIGNGTMTAYGLLCANYTLVDNKKTPISSAFQLPNAYVMSNTKITHLGTNGGASKGFRCFFVHNTDNQASPKFYLDGISDDTTSIDDITANDVETWNIAPRFRRAIYNANGQLVRYGTSLSGLSSGLYIVDGQKIAVK